MDRSCSSPSRQGVGCATPSVKPADNVKKARAVGRAGRTGVAYSLFTRDELPFALDLHLFLGRGLAPAPRRSVSDAAAAGAEAGGQDGDAQATSVFGSFPLVRAAAGSAVLHAAQHQL
jgi:hypothetical protein